MYQSPAPLFEGHSAFELSRQKEKKELRREVSFIGTLSLVLTLVMQFAFSVVVIILIHLGLLSADDLSDTYLGLNNTMYMIMYSAIYVGTLLIPTIVVALIFKKREFPFTPARDVPFGLVLLIVLSAVGLCMLSNIVNSYILAIFASLGLSVPEAPQTMENTPISFVLNLFTIAVLPALLEEMIYRGYILRVLRPYGSVYAILVSSMLFSLMHGNLRQIPFAFIVGLVLGFVYVLTDNIWIPIAVHFANNAISVVMEYFAFSLPDDYQAYFYAIIIYGLAAVGVFSVILTGICYYRRMRVEQSGSLLTPSNRFGILFSTPIFLISVVLYLILLFVEI